MGFRFLEDNLVSEAIHIIATKEGVKIPVEDERNYALYHDKILLDFNKSLGSFNFDDNVIDYFILFFFYQVFIFHILFVILGGINS